MQFGNATLQSHALSVLPPVILESDVLQRLPAAAAKSLSLRRISQRNQRRCSHAIGDSEETFYLLFIAGVICGQHRA